MLGQYLLRQLNYLRQCNVLCDLELVSGDETCFLVHQVIFISLNKRHFHMATQNPGMQQQAFPPRKKIWLSAVCSIELKIVIDFLYGKRVWKNTKYDSLLAALEKLEMIYLLDEADDLIVVQQEDNFAVVDQPIIDVKEVETESRTSDSSQCQPQRNNQIHRCVNHEVKEEENECELMKQNSSISVSLQEGRNEIKLEHGDEISTDQIIKQAKNMDSNSVSCHNFTHGNELNQIFLKNGNTEACNYGYREQNVTIEADSLSHIDMARIYIKQEPLINEDRQSSHLQVQSIFELPRQNESVYKNQNDKYIRLSQEKRQISEKETASDIQSITFKNQQSRMTGNTEKYRNISNALSIPSIGSPENMSQLNSPNLNSFVHENVFLKTLVETVRANKKADNITKACSKRKNRFDEKLEFHINEDNDLHKVPVNSATGATSNIPLSEIITVTICSQTNVAVANNPDSNVFSSNLNVERGHSFKKIVAANKIEKKSNSNRESTQMSNDKVGLTDEMNLDVNFVCKNRSNCIEIINRPNLVHDNMPQHQKILDEIKEMFEVTASSMNKTNICNNSKNDVLESPGKINLDVDLKATEGFVETVNDCANSKITKKICVGGCGVELQSNVAVENNTECITGQTNIVDSSDTVSGLSLLELKTCYNHNFTTDLASNIDSKKCSLESVNKWTTDHSQKYTEAIPLNFENSATVLKRITGSVSNDTISVSDSIDNVALCKQSQSETSFDDNLKTKLHGIHQQNITSNRVFNDINPSELTSESAIVSYSTLSNIPASEILTINPQSLCRAIFANKNQIYPAKQLKNVFTKDKPVHLNTNDNKEHKCGSEVISNDTVETTAQLDNTERVKSPVSASDMITIPTTNCGINSNNSTGNNYLLGNRKCISPVKVSKSPVRYHPYRPIKPKPILSNVMVCNPVASGMIHLPPNLQQQNVKFVYATEYEPHNRSVYELNKQSRLKMRETKRSTHTAIDISVKSYWRIPKNSSLKRKLSTQNGTFQKKSMLKNQEGSSIEKAAKSDNIMDLQSSRCNPIVHKELISQSVQKTIADNDQVINAKSLSFNNNNPGDSDKVPLAKLQQLIHSGRSSELKSNVQKTSIDDAIQKQVTSTVIILQKKSNRYVAIRNIASSCTNTTKTSNLCHVPSLVNSADVDSKNFDKITDCDASDTKDCIENYLNPFATDSNSLYSVLHYSADKENGIKYGSSHSNNKAAPLGTMKKSQETSKVISEKLVVLDADIPNGTKQVLGTDSKLTLLPKKSENGSFSSLLWDSQAAVKSPKKESIEPPEPKNLAILSGMESYVSGKCKGSELYNPCPENKNSCLTKYLFDDTKITIDEAEVNDTKINVEHLNCSNVRTCYCKHAKAKNTEQNLCKDTVNKNYVHLTHTGKDESPKDCIGNPRVIQGNAHKISELEQLLSNGILMDSDSSSFPYGNKSCSSYVASLPTKKRSPTKHMNATSRVIPGAKSDTVGVDSNTSLELIKQDVESKNKHRHGNLRLLKCEKSENVSFKDTVGLQLESLKARRSFELTKKRRLGCLKKRNPVQKLLCLSEPLNTEVNLQSGNSSKSLCFRENNSLQTGDNLSHTVCIPCTSGKFRKILPKPPSFL